jgi:hypothetical protein
MVPAPLERGERRCYVATSEPIVQYRSHTSADLDTPCEHGGAIHYITMWEEAAE